MTDINAGPLTKRAYELCRQADSLPYAGLELTALITAMSEFIRTCEARERGYARSLLRWKAYERKAIEMAHAVYDAYAAYEDPHFIATKIGDLIDFLEDPNGRAPDVDRGTP